MQCNTKMGKSRKPPILLHIYITSRYYYCIYLLVFVYTKYIFYVVLSIPFISTNFVAAVPYHIFPAMQG